MLTHPRRAARLAPFLRAAWRNDRVGRLLPKWAAVLNAGLRRKHPELFDGSRDKMLEVVPKGASGLGVDVKKGVSIPKGTVLGAYFGCLGTRLGNDDYTVEMPPGSSAPRRAQVPHRCQCGSRGTAWDRSRASGSVQSRVQEHHLAWRVVQVRPTVLPALQSSPPPDWRHAIDVELRWRKKDRGIHAKPRRGCGAAGCQALPLCRSR